ncbi:vWA domain-containing protein [Halosimplex pelagicum]|uniref:VWA domain-containing protein n=1 Tax=Halosimplex pelagicum TaxID=869886 RepID=A0A7D5TAN3_9EURY|nr:VWA domain-containing protein [Halosimplex pelagicum]QLH80615.1 VWA domain-containing protein [Halosimplex pelagicum]
MNRDSADARGQTGIIGMVLLIGLVLTGAMVVLYGGSTVIESLQQDRSDTSARVVMEGADSKLATLTNSEYSARERFSLGELNRNRARLVRDGFLNVTVNKNATCATNIPLSSIRYENADDEVVAYEAGGVWVGGDEGSAMQTAPDFQFRNGSLDIAVTNMTGEVANDNNRAFYNATTSQRESVRRSQQVITGTCARPNNVTVEVRSDFYEAWGQYLEEELGTEPETFDSNRTVRVTLPQSMLPRRVDDSRNHVINMSGAPYMDDVEIDGNTVRVTKDTSNQYSVYVEALSKNRVDIGQIRRIEDAQNVTGPPLDVVFVFDESGSMGDPADPSCSTGCQTKREAAIDATQNFTDVLNSSRDRVGLIGFRQDAEGRAQYYRTHENYLTEDFTEFDADTVDGIDADGYTYVWAGLRDSNQLLHLKSNQTRERVVVLLSDGENNCGGCEAEIDGSDEDPDPATKIYADRAAEIGATVHTIGFGPGRDESLLRYINESTGGQYYYAEDAEELNDAFENIASRVSSTKQIARLPTSTSLQTGAGGAYAPQIAGDTDRVAVNVTDGTRYLNINDPTSPTLFSHAFAVTDNETVSFNASTYNCAEWRGTGITRSHNGSTYQVTRCSNMTTRDDAVGAGNASVFLDGKNMTSFFERDDPAWWQESVRDAIDSRSDVRLNTTTNITHMKSNQALVVLDYPDGTNSTNRLVLLYQIGLAESEARPEGIVNIRVNDVRVAG